MTKIDSRQFNFEFCELESEKEREIVSVREIEREKRNKNKQSETFKCASKVQYPISIELGEAKTKKNPN